MTITIKQGSEAGCHTTSHLLLYDLHICPDRSVFGSSLHLDRTDRSKQLRWTEPIGPGDTDGPDRTNSIGSIRLGLKSVGPGRYRSGPDRGCPYLATLSNCSSRCYTCFEWE